MSDEPKVATKTAASDALGTQGLLLAKAMSHPVRVDALRILTERPASPSDIARELGLPVANVSYHVNTLMRLGFIEEVEHRHVRGSIEHIYRAIRRAIISSEEWAHFPDSAKNAFLSEWFKTTLRDLREAIDEGWIDEMNDHHLTRTPLRLDEQAWTELSDRLNDLLHWAIGLQADANERLKKGNAGGREVSALMISAYIGRLTES